jgi:glyoxylase-like metal-dependent hydrolase (beta-lactamase superfamily II)
LSWNRVFAAALAAACVATSGTAFAQGGFGPQELAISQFRDNIYLIRSAASGNITALVADDGVLLIDSKFEREYDRYMELLRTVTDKPVRYLINTHVHPDHTGGNARLEGIGAEIVATGNTRRRLAASQPAGLPAITFDDQVRIWFGGKPLDLYWLGRGHTDGDLVIHMPEDGIVFTGDLFAGYEPNIRLIDYSGGGSLAEWPATLDRVLALEFDVVIPGHSGPTDRAMLQQYRDENVRMQEIIREMHGAGRSPQDIQTALAGEFGNMAFTILPGIQAAIDELQSGDHAPGGDNAVNVE